MITRRRRCRARYRQTCEPTVSTDSTATWSSSGRAGATVRTGADGGGVIAPIVGHEGSFAPDGLTYYGGGRTVPNNYYAVDISDATNPKLIASWNVPRVATGARTHGLSVSDDGKRGYFVSIG